MAGTDTKICVNEEAVKEKTGQMRTDSGTVTLCNAPVMVGKYTIGPEYAELYKQFAAYCSEYSTKMGNDLTTIDKAAESMIEQDAEIAKGINNAGL